MQLDIPIVPLRTVKFTDEELERRTRELRDRIVELENRTDSGLSPAEMAEWYECMELRRIYRDRLKFRDHYRRNRNKILAQQDVRRSQFNVETPEQEAQRRESRKDAQADYAASPKGKAARRRANAKYKVKRRSLQGDLRSDEEKEDAKLEAALAWIFESQATPTEHLEHGGAV